MFKLIIETKNDAFQEDVRGQIAFILDQLVEDIRNGKEPSRLQDQNGNNVGVITWGI